MQKWEFLEVTLSYENYVYRIRDLNKQELRDWKKGPNWIDYLNQL